MTNDTRAAFEAWSARDPDVPAGLRWDSPIILSYERCWAASRRAALEEAARICDETWVTPGDSMCESCHEAAAKIRALGDEGVKP